MQAMVWDGERATVQERQQPSASDGWAVVRPTRVGVCNTDLEIVRGYLGFRGVLGHEMAGIVEEGPDAWRRKRVVSEINFACGKNDCASCRAGLGRHCPNRTVMGIVGADGAMAEAVRVPVANLREVPNALSDDVATFTEPVAAAFEILEQAHVTTDMRCTVLGDGKLGSLCAQALYTTGAEVTCVGKHDSKLAFLRERGLKTTLLQAWDRAPADLVVDATGSASGLELALSVTKPRGTVVLKSTVADRPQIDLAPIVIHEIRVVGSRCGRFEPALRALAARSVVVDGLIAHHYPLERAAEALDKAGERGTQKVLIDCA